MKKAPPRGNGGRRAGAGRKPKAATLLRRKLAEHGTAEAEKSFSWLCAWRDDAGVPVAIRVECAKTILDRVLGKAIQPITTPERRPIQIQAVDYRAAITAITTGSEPDSPASGQDEGSGHGPALGKVDDGRSD